MTVLDTGHPPLWPVSEEQRLGRCPTCEWHPPTQGHHRRCAQLDLVPEVSLPARVLPNRTPTFCDICAERLGIADWLVQETTCHECETRTRRSRR